MLEVKKVSKQYKGEDKLLYDAVSEVSLSMADHCIYALVGESGRANPAERKTNFTQREKKPERNGESGSTGIPGWKERP